MESDQLLACCGLNDDEWDSELPRLYTLMLEEGRSTNKVRAILQAQTRPTEVSMDAVELQITDDMAKDVKNLHFVATTTTSPTVPVTEELHHSLSSPSKVLRRQHDAYKKVESDGLQRSLLTTTLSRPQIHCPRISTGCCI
jgi:hypothetical protein